MRGDNSANTLFGLGLALSLGRLVGLERGWQERAAVEGSRIAGIRTFGLIGLLGGLWELLARGTGEVLLGLAFFGSRRLSRRVHAALFFFSSTRWTTVGFTSFSKSLYRR